MDRRSFLTKAALGGAGAAALAAPALAQEAEGEVAVHGLRVRMGVRCKAEDAVAVAELQLGENARFFPSDAALAAWTAQAGPGAATVVYE